jgi:hypothetical protein
MVKAGVVIPFYHDELVSADGEMKPSPEVPDILTFAQLYEQINGRLPSGILWEALKIINMTQLMQRFSRRLLLWSRTPNLSKTSRKLPSPLLDIKSRQKEKSREEMSTAACLGTDPLELSRAAIQKEVSIIFKEDGHENTISEKSFPCLGDLLSSWSCI